MTTNTPSQTKLATPSGAPSAKVAESSEPANPPAAGQDGEKKETDKDASAPDQKTTTTATVAAPAPPKKEEHKQIGNFTVGKTKGKGTFGKVKQGTHDPTNEKVAIKILEKEKIKDHADLERINREITILKKVRHPNVVQLYDMIENNDYLYLIMEYCSGGELFQHIVKNRRLKEAEACKMYAQILSGIEYIHKLGVVHRDLKPENLLLDHNNNIKLVDFGLSNLYKDGQKLKTACGSPCYAAPEMIRGERYFGLGADIWSSGVILYAMICGYLPFEDQNTKKLYQKIIKADYKMPSFLSEQAQDLINNILNPDPASRFGIEDIRNHPWYSICEHSPPYTPPIYLGKEPIPIDAKIMGMLVKDHKIDEAKAEQEIKRNRFNNITTTYYLLLKRKERAGMFRQQYNEDVKKLLRRGKKGPSPTPTIRDDAPAKTTQSPTNPTQTTRNTPTPAGISEVPQNSNSPRQGATTSQVESKGKGQDSVSKKPTTAAPVTMSVKADDISARGNDAGNIGVIQAVTVVSPQNIKRIANKPKTVDAVNVINVKKTPVVVKGKATGNAAAMNSIGGPSSSTQQKVPLTLQVDMINRNSALTPSVNGDVAENINVNTVLSQEIKGQPPRPGRRQHQSNDERQGHIPAAMARPVHHGMNSTVNRGFQKPAPALHHTRNGNEGSGGQVNLHNVPNSTKSRGGYGALIAGVPGYPMRNQARAANNTVDPFARVNPKARKLIESVERNRHNTSERRTGSTGGSSTQQVDLTAISGTPTTQMLNQTAQNFYSPNRGQGFKDQVNGAQNRPNIQIQIPGAQGPSPRHQHLQAPSYQNYLFSETPQQHYRTPVNMQQMQQPYSVRNSSGTAGQNQVYSPSGTVSPQIQQSLQMQQRQYPQVRPAQGNLFNSKLGGGGQPVAVDRNATQHSNPMQIIANLQSGKTKQRSYSRAYDSPRNGQFSQYSTRNKGPGKGGSQTVNGQPNQRRINQTIDVGAAIEHLDLDVGINSGTPNDLQTIQPMDMTSPMGATKIPHQPVTPSLQVNQPGQNAQKKGVVNNGFMMVNQRQSPMNKQHENNFMGVPNKKTGSVGPQTSNGFKNYQAPSASYNNSALPHQNVKNKKGMRGPTYNYVKNQSVQITGGDESLGNTLSAHEAATFYSSAMNTQQILNSRRQPKRFGAGSVVGTTNTNSSGNGKNSIGGGNNNVGMNINSTQASASGQMAIGSKMQSNKYKSNNSPTGFQKTFY